MPSATGANARVELPALQAMFPPLSLIEILDELSRLTHEALRLLCRRALAIEEADDSAALAYTAAGGFALLDRMEAEDAARGKNG